MARTSPATAVRLLGMTWDHPRGLAPMVATSRRYAQEHPGVEITWETRSLQAFADAPLEELARRYDLIVIDHPHVGMAARAGCLLALDGLGRDDQLAALAAQSLGPSHPSYHYDGRQWALAIDAATQVASHRPDLLAAAPTHWAQVLELARQGRVLWPIKPIDALMSFMTLAANRGTPCSVAGAAGEPLLPPGQAAAVLRMMGELAAMVPRDCLTMNPIETYERLSDAGNRAFAYCPLAYGYTNYARAGFRPNRLAFGDIAQTVEGAGPRGSTIGGTGIAVSSRTAHRDVAVDYAFWIASANCQRGLYFEAGGQPGNAQAWSDPACNAATRDFFTATRRTLDNVYLRPRYNGYLAFQDEGGNIVHAFLHDRSDPLAAAQALEAAYLRSLR